MNQALLPRTQPLQMTKFKMFLFSMYIIEKLFDKKKKSPKYKLNKSCNPFFLSQKLHFGFNQKILHKNIFFFFFQIHSHTHIESDYYTYLNNKTNIYFLFQI